MLEGDGLPYLHHHMQINKEMEPDIKPLTQPNHAHSSAGSSLVSFLPPPSIHSPPPTISSPGQHPVPQSSHLLLPLPLADDSRLHPSSSQFFPILLVWLSYLNLFCSAIGQLAPLLNQSQ